MNRLALAVLLAAPVAHAAEAPAVPPLDRRAVIAPGAPRPFAVAPVSREELLNGMKLAAVHSTRHLVVAIELALPYGGSAHDPAGREGLASLVSSLLTEGAGGRDADAFQDAVQDLGARVSVSASADALIVKLFARKENADAALGLVADLVRRPALPEPSLDRLREEALAGLQAQKGDPGALAEKRLAATLHAGHPYGRSETPASVAAITRADAAAAAARLADPRGARLTSAGALSLDELKALAEKHFGDWAGSGALPAGIAAVPVPQAAPAGPAVALPGSAPVATQPASIELFDMPGSGQSAVRFGLTAVTRDHPDFYALRVLMEVLGGGQGRLHRNIREEKGWAYGAYAFYQPRRAGGEIAGQTDVQTDRTADAVREILAEVERIRRDPVPADELERAKLYAAGGFLRRQQKVQDQAAQATAAVLAGLPADEMSRYREKLLAVDAAQVMAAARRHLDPAALRIVISGDAEKVYEGLAAIAPTSVLDAEGAPKAPPVKKPSNS
jgi:zinc protease